MVTAHVNGLSPWKFAGLLGDMTAVGVTCTGDGERYFAELRNKVQEV